MEKIQAKEMILASGRTLWIKAGDIQKSYIKHTNLEQVTYFRRLD